MTQYGVICKQCLRPAYLTNPVVDNGFVCDDCLAMAKEYDKGFSKGLLAGVGISLMAIGFGGLVITIF